MSDRSYKYARQIMGYDECTENQDPDKKQKCAGQSMQWGENHGFILNCIISPSRIRGRKRRGIFCTPCQRISCFFYEGNRRVCAFLYRGNLGVIRVGRSGFVRIDQLAGFIVDVNFRRIRSVGFISDDRAEKFLTALNSFNDPCSLLAGVYICAIQ